MRDRTSQQDAPYAGRCRYPIGRLLWPALLLLAAAGCRQGGPPAPPERGTPLPPVAKVGDYRVATAGREICLAPASAGGTLYLAQPNSLVCALDASTGALRFSVDTAARLGAGRPRDAAFSSETGAVYLLAEPDQVVALQAEPLAPREALGLATPDTAAALDLAAIAASPDGGRLAIVDRGNHRVTLLAASPLRIIGRVTVGKRPVDAAFAPDGRRLYVACEGPGEIGVVDVDGLKVVGRIALGDGTPTGIAVAPEGERIYAATRDPGQVLEVDTTAGEILRRSAAPGGHLRLAPDGRCLFTWGPEGELGLIETQGMRPVALPPLEGSVLDVALSDDGLAYVALAMPADEVKVSVLRIAPQDAPGR